MKKRTFKKLVTAMAVMILFSSTIVYGAAGSYDFTLNPTQYLYSNAQPKFRDTTYATVEQTSPASVIQYTVVNNENTVISNTVTISGVDDENITYTVKVAHIITKPLKLKAYNYPADNAGGVRNAAGVWTP